MFENENDRTDRMNGNVPENNGSHENDTTINSADNGNNSVNNGASFGVAYVPENSSAKENASGARNEYTYVPYGTSRTANGSTSGNGKNTKKKKSNHLAAVLSCVVVLCVLFSAAAGFGGTYLANRVSNKGNGEQASVGATGTVELLQSGRTVETLKIGSTGTQMTVAETAALVKDSVVEITTENVQSNAYLGQYVQSGAGSGVIISADGYIVTNNHVIENTSKITVRLTDKTEYEAALIGTDDVADIAVIKIKPTDGVKLSVAVLGDSDKLVVGESVLAIGNPLGELGGTVTDGIVSALDREVSVEGKKMNLLQTNAAINPGNSGGGLFNLYGELVGIVNAKYSSTGVEGLGFVIPINKAKSVAEQLIEYGYVRGRPAIGITVIDADMYTAWRYYGSAQPGAYVEKADDSTGLQRGDRIISINDTEVSSSSDITNCINSLVVGDNVKLVVMRHGKTVEVTLTLKEKTQGTSSSESN